MPRPAYGYIIDICHNASGDLPYVAILRSQAAALGGLLLLTAGPSPQAAETELAKVLATALHREVYALGVHIQPAMYFCVVCKEFLHGLADCNTHRKDKHNYKPLAL